MSAPHIPHRTSNAHPLYGTGEILGRCLTVFLLFEDNVGCFELILCKFLEGKVDVVEDLEARVTPQKHTLKVPSPGMLSAHK